ncbi:hypothetical protein EVAR_37997_1 [Eumeta japonica]|uniref:Uncharacterized protein n=1 Tax=Eumeta variegata TaxID=151549 RepID=A0A4C1WYC6_EUMVA|nr:hypothetical protein EVAR_37997_1 [Eumeta japonica]
MFNDFGINPDHGPASDSGTGTVPDFDTDYVLVSNSDTTFGFNCVPVLNLGPAPALVSGLRPVFHSAILLSVTVLIHAWRARAKPKKMHYLDRYDSFAIIRYSRKYSSVQSDGAKRNSNVRYNNRSRTQKRSGASITKTLVINRTKEGELSPAPLVVLRSRGPRRGRPPPTRLYAVSSLAETRRTRVLMADFPKAINLPSVLRALKLHIQRPVYVGVLSLSFSLPLPQYDVIEEGSDCLPKLVTTNYHDEWVSSEKLSLLLPSAPHGEGSIARGTVPMASGVHQRNRIISGVFSLGNPPGFSFHGPPFVVRNKASRLTPARGAGGREPLLSALCSASLCRIGTEISIAHTTCRVINDGNSKMKNDERRRHARHRTIHSSRDRGSMASTRREVYSPAARRRPDQLLCAAATNGGGPGPHAHRDIDNVLHRALKLA